MKKENRQRKILDLINLYEIGTQEDLVAKLIEEGFDVTQATVSRDIRELNLYKISTDNGGQKYCASKVVDHTLDAKYKRVLKDGFISIDMAQNILVIKTVSGMAMAVCAAIDSLHYSEIVGTIAGDDTIMMAIRTDEAAKGVMEKIRNLANNN